MKEHVRRGLITSLAIFILLMIWGVIGSYLDPNPEVENLPMYYSIQKYWLFAWSLISVVLSFIVFVIASVLSLLYKVLRA